MRTAGAGAWEPLSLHQMDLAVERDERRHMRRPTGQSHYSKLTEQLVRSIRKLHADGVPLPMICQRYPEVTRWTIREVIARRSWRHVR